MIPSKSQLIGIRYPVVSHEDNSVIAFRRIKKVYTFHDHAAYGLSLSNSDQLHFVSYKEAENLVNNSESLKDLIDMDQRDDMKENI